MLVSEIGCNGGSEVVAGLKITFYVYKCLSSICIFFVDFQKSEKVRAMLLMGRPN